MVWLSVKAVPARVINEAKSDDSMIINEGECDGTVCNDR